MKMWLDSIYQLDIQNNFVVYQENNDQGNTVAYKYIHENILKRQSQYINCVLYVRKEKFIVQDVVSSVDHVPSSVKKNKIIQRINLLREN